MRIFGRNLTINTALGRARRVFYRRKAVFETISPASGRIGVYDLGWERVLSINGQIQSVFFRRSGWGEAKRDYWGHLANPPFETPAGSDVLMLGLGGGTTLHLLTPEIRPGSVTVVERDPVVIGAAQSYFDLGRIPGLLIVEGDALEVLKRLSLEHQSFDLVIDDVFFSATSALTGPGRDIYEAMRALLRPGGSMVLNRPVDRPEETALHRAYAEELRSLGNEVITRSVRESGWNDIIYCRPGRE